MKHCAVGKQETPAKTQKLPFSLKHWQFKGLKKQTDRPVSFVVVVVYLFVIKEVSVVLLGVNGGLSVCVFFEDIRPRIKYFCPCRECMFMDNADYKL